VLSKKSQAANCPSFEGAGFFSARAAGCNLLRVYYAEDCESMTFDAKTGASPLWTRAHWFSKAAGIFSALVGFAVLAGWLFNIQTLKSIYPGLASMKSMTALDFVLCGFALWAFQVPGDTRRAGSQRPLAIAASAITVVIGLLTLLEYWLHLDLGVDQFPLRDTAVGQPFLGRMSPLSALAFILVGTALLLLEINKPVTRRLSRVASSLSAAVALMALFGYAYSITVLYKPAFFTGMAVHTAAVFVLLSAGLLCAQPDEGLVAALLRKSPGGTVMRRTVPVSLVAAFLLGWLRLHGQHMGLYGTEMGAAILVVSAGTIFVFSAAWAAKAVDAGEEQFRRVMEAAPTGMILVAERGKIVLVNAQVEKLFGYHRSELLGQSIEALVPERFRGRHPEFRASFAADPKARVMGAGSDLYGLRQDASEFPVEIGLNPVESPEGRFVLTSVVDITERKRVALEIQQSKDVLERFVEYAPASIAMFDRNMRYVVASRQWHRECGIGDQSVVGKSHYDIFPTLPEHWKREHQRGMAGETRKAEEEWVAPDGRKHIVRWELHPWGDSGALTGGIIIFMEDITERKMAEMERQKFVSLADQSAEFIGMCDLEFKPFYANPSGLRLVGIDTLEEALRTRVNEFFFPEDQRFILEEFFPKVLREGRSEVEIRFRHFKSGDALWMIYNVFQVKGTDGRPVGYATVSRDITERKRVESEREELLRKLQTLTSELETRVSERTAQLSNTLREREVLLQEIHHRVKNNLQVISSLMNMQMRRIKHQPSREALQECQTRVQAIALIHGMLYQSRDYSSIPFSEYARGLAANVFHAAGVTAGAISMELAIEDVCLGVDQAIPCGLILNELISNALKHAFPNGRHGVIRVELRRIEPGRLLLAVKDDGVGLPPDIDVKTSPSLGLHLVCSLAEQLGAEVEIVRDKGTSLKFTFAAGEPLDSRNAVSPGSILEAAG
jgi:PAS domain S-box-containing protein